MLLPMSGSSTLPAYCRALRVLHDLPDQELVVGLGERVLVVGDADRALDPPVRRVEAVGVVLAGEDHRVAGGAVVGAAGLGDLVDELLGGVDADVAALGVVVVVGELPVDDLGQPARHRDRQGAARAQHPDELLDRVDVGVDVLEHLCGDDAVELTVGEGQGERVALLHVGLRAGRHLTGVAHRGEPLADGRELVGVPVEGDDVGATLVHLEGVAPGAAAHVQHPVAGAQPQAVEVNGQHCGSPPALADPAHGGSRRWSPRRRRRWPRRRRAS